MENVLSRENFVTVNKIHRTTCTGSIGLQFLYKQHNITTQDSALDMCDGQEALKWQPGLNKKDFLPTSNEYLTIIPSFKMKQKTTKLEFTVLWYVYASKSSYNNVLCKDQMFKACPNPPDCT